MPQPVQSRIAGVVEEISALPWLLAPRFSASPRSTRGGDSPLRTNAERTISAGLLKGNDGLNTPDIGERRFKYGGGRHAH
jgi:hypothetical protein